MRRRFEFDNDAQLVSGGGPVRRRLSLIADTPGVAIFCSLLTLALAVLIFIPAVPGEERVLMYRGEQVEPTAICESGTGGELEVGVCAEFGTFEVRETGWSIPGVVVAVVLAALATVVLARVPAQIREHRRQRPSSHESMTDEDRFQSR